MKDFDSIVGMELILLDGEGRLLLEGLVTGFVTENAVIIRAEDNNVDTLRVLPLITIAQQGILFETRQHLLNWKMAAARPQEPAEDPNRSVREAVLDERVGPPTPRGGPGHGNFGPGVA